MAWRSVVIQNPARLSLAHSQLLIEQDHQKATVPLEDITTLVFDNPQITLNHALMSALQQHGIATVICDDKHMPSGLLLPFHQHSRQAEVAALQVAWRKPFTKRLWQQIVQQKINSQATCLVRNQREGAKRLYALSDRVGSGDPQNIEAQAAKAYWPCLFGKDFRRGKMDTTNAALNYGYAVVRAVVARAIVAYGLLPSFGIHHGNNLNAFNLADDLIEVFRPFVDDHVAKMALDNTADLSKADRASLAQLGHTHCAMGIETHTITNAAELMAAELVANTRHNDAKLRLPTFILQK